MQTQRIKQTTQNVIQKDRVKLEDIEQEKSIKKSSNKYENVKIGIIIPAYNEEKNIENVLKRLHKYNNYEFDIIVIDDGSTDKTCHIIDDYNVFLLKHEKNKGNGAATITGLRYCRENNYDIVLIMDADGQHDPSDIPYFLDKIIAENNDFVIGNRFKYVYQGAPLKKLCSLILTVLYLILYRKKVSDPTNGFRALSSKVVNKINLESQYSVTQEMLFKVIPYFKWKEIPIKVFKRENGHSFIKLKYYFLKMIYLTFKFYLLPKLRKAENTVNR